MAEYEVQKSPIRTGHLLHSDIPGYERGTWTPTVGGDATYVTQEGHYERVGHAVALHCYLRINTLGTGSVRNISGVPTFGATRVIGTFPVSWIVLENTFVYVIGQMAGEIVGGALTANITLMSTSTAATSLGLNTVLGNSSEFYLTGIYNLLGVQI